MGYSKSVMPVRRSNARTTVLSRAQQGRQVQGHLAEVEASLGGVESASARLVPLTETSDDPDYAAQLAGILTAAGRHAESDPWRQHAAIHYDDLVIQHPAAFADHARRISSRRWCRSPPCTRAGSVESAGPLDAPSPRACCAGRRIGRPRRTWEVVLETWPVAIETSRISQTSSTPARSASEPLSAALRTHRHPGSFQDLQDR